MARSKNIQPVHIHFFKKMDYFIQGVHTLVEPGLGNVASKSHSVG
jgi:hypothetical protein